MLFVYNFLLVKHGSFLMSSYKRIYLVQLCQDIS
uniref:Uncharacterized protein n=1 Tax=Arundo donax TaxID=35708 RepID=A0A0A8ZXV8_ARUDO